jgi:hypothetical protein
MTTLAPSLPRRAVHLLGAAVFLALICLPLGDAVFHLAPAINVMEAAPGRDPFAGTGPAGVLDGFNILRQGYLDKTFGFRKLLVRWENHLKYGLLESSTADLAVVAGPDGWLFLARENPRLNTVDDFRGTRLFTPAELAAWTAEFTARRDWLAARGIPYLVVMAPNKQTVYPEKLPARYNQVGPTRTDQLVAALAGAGIAVADLRPVLLEAKKAGQVYYRTDSHWTPAGTSAAYAGIMEALGRAVPALAGATPFENDPASLPGVPGDLAAMLGLGDGGFAEEKFGSAPKGGLRAVRTEAPDLSGPGDLQPAEAYEIPGSTLPRAVIFRDSFAQDLIPLLSGHFSRAVFQWPFPSTYKAVRRFDRELVERERPDVVVDEIVERYFIVPPPVATP